RLQRERPRGAEVVAAHAHPCAESPGPLSPDHPAGSGSFREEPTRSSRVTNLRTGPRMSYRHGVVAVVRNPDGLLLIGERSDLPGTWQFPQGGRMPGETPEETLARELTEE